MKYWKITSRPTYLMHHGVEGQKWGVRHGPPYPIQDTILRRGTKLSSVSDTKKTEDYRNRDRMLYTWQTGNEIDTEIYRGPFTAYLKWWGGAKNGMVFEHQFETLRDLKMPTSKQRLDEFVDLYNNSTGADRKKFTDELNGIFYQIAAGGKDSGLYKSAKGDDYNLAKITFDNEGYGYDDVKANYKQKLLGKSAASAYAVFNHAMEASHAHEITRQYVKRIKSKYDAMVDDNNVNIYNGAQDPIIIFEPGKDLKSITKKGRQIKNNEMNLNLQKVRNRNEGRAIY